MGLIARIRAYFRRKSYNRYIRSPEWEKKREAVLRRDGYKCFICESTERLEAHHLSYRDFKKEKLYQVITVCKKCHKRLHKKIYKKDLYA